MQPRPPRVPDAPNRFRHLWLPRQPVVGCRHRQQVDDLPPGEVRQLDLLGQQLVSLRPAMVVRPSKRRFIRQPRNEGAQAPDAGPIDLDAKVEAVEPLEVGLDARPMLMQGVREARYSPSSTP